MRIGHKATDVADYVLWLACESEKSLTPMQLLKLVYLCHGWMLGIHARPLIWENVEAWKYGPVIPSVYHAYKKFGGGPIPIVPKDEPEGFDEPERDIMKQVWDAYGRFNGIQLSTITHEKNSPWDITFRDDARGVPIPNDLIADHFGKLAAPHS